MAHKINDQIDKRFQSIEESELHCQATMLDPRFKKYGFFDEIKFKKAQDILKRKVTSVSICSESESAESVDKELSSSTHQRPSFRKKKIEDNIWDDFDTEVHIFQRTSSTPYWKSLNWWKERATVYPRLFQIVKKRLCLVATSVPCEKIFPKTGQILSDRRNRLGAKKLLGVGVMLQVQLCSQYDARIHQQNSTRTGLGQVAEEGALNLATPGTRQVSLKPYVEEHQVKTGRGAYALEEEVCKLSLMKVCRLKM
nr:unnamed protein product [Callosobruchus analis]